MGSPHPPVSAGAARAVQADLATTRLVGPCPDSAVVLPWVRGVLFESPWLGFPCAVMQLPHFRPKCAGFLYKTEVTMQRNRK